MNESKKIFGQVVQEYINQMGDTVFELNGSFEELRNIYKDIRNIYLGHNDIPMKIENDGRILYIKHCHAITNILTSDRSTVIRIITSPEPVISRSPKGDQYKVYL